MVHLGKSERPRAMSVPYGASASDVALEEDEFKVALEKSGFSGNASQAWRQLGSGDGLRSTKSSTRDLAVDRAQTAARSARSADGARDTASARSERRSNSVSSAQRSGA